jgi:lipopolysaccharide biosynthesis glycosyltransferase
MSLEVEPRLSADEANVVVATATDDNYLLPWMVLAYSFSRFHPDHPLTLAYFEDALSGSSIEKVSQFQNSTGVRVNLWNLGHESEEGHRYISKTTFAKFRYLSLNKPIIWLDTDMVVLQPLTQLFQEVMKPSSSKPFLVAERDGQPKEGFNAGFFCKRKGPQPIEDWQSRVTRTGHNLENQVFTAAFSGRAEFVSEAYNTLAGWAAPERLSSPTILHFPGAIKPWHILDARQECLRQACTWSRWYSVFEELNKLLRNKKQLDLVEIDIQKATWEGVRRSAVEILEGGPISRLLRIPARLLRYRTVDALFLKKRNLSSKNLHPVHFRS